MAYLLIVIVIMAALVFIFAKGAKERTNPPGTNPPGTTPPPAGGLKGADLWVERNANPHYVADFIHKRYPEKLLPLMQSIIGFAGYDLNAIAAICAWETGWISDPNARLPVCTKNNILGITLDGHTKETFSNIETCLKRFLEVLQHSRYYYARQTAGIGEVFIANLRSGGYNSNQSWQDGVIACYRRIKAG